MVAEPFYTGDRWYGDQLEGPPFFLRKESERRAIGGGGRPCELEATMTGDRGHVLGEGEPLQQEGGGSSTGGLPQLALYERSAASSGKGGSLLITNGERQGNSPSGTQKRKQEVRPLHLHAPLLTVARDLHRGSLPIPTRPALIGAETGSYEK